ncbi:MAG: hypothetical protein AAF192_16645 [Pseudomonadota bacterium]
MLRGMFYGFFLCALAAAVAAALNPLPAERFPAPTAEAADG